MARLQPQPQPEGEPARPLEPALPAALPIPDMRVQAVTAVLGLNSRRKETLDAIFDHPTRANIPWRDIEALFDGLGGEVTQGNGSRVRVSLLGVRAVFHSPHPDRDTKKYAVENVRSFLTSTGILL